MSTFRRVLLALLAAAACIAAGGVLIRDGGYRWTLFGVLPTLLGGLSAWAIQPSCGISAAALGAATILVASALAIGSKLEGMLCALMAVPLIVPLGALG